MWWTESDCNSYLSLKKVDDLSLSLQGCNINILFLGDEVKAFITKLGLWKNWLVRNYEIFPCFIQFIGKNEVDFEYDTPRKSEL